MHRLWQEKRDQHQREAQDLARDLKDTPIAAPAGRALSFHACCVRRDRRRKITGRSCCRPPALARLRGGGMGEGFVLHDTFAARRESTSTRTAWRKLDKHSRTSDLRVEGACARWHAVIFGSLRCSECSSTWLPRPSSTKARQRPGRTASMPANASSPIISAG